MVFDTELVHLYLSDSVQMSIKYHWYVKTTGTTKSYSLLLIIKQVNNSRISIWERIGKLVYLSFLYKDNYFSLYLRKVHICVVKFHYDLEILSLVLSYTECKQNNRAKSYSF